MLIINKFLIIFPILLYPLISILALFVLGFGLTYLSLPKSLKVFWFWLSPWTSIVFGIFYFVVASLIGISVNQAIIPYIIFLIGMDLYVLVKIRPKLNFKVKYDFLLVILVGLSLLLNLSPLIRRDRFINTISMGNNDVIAYATTADYLKEHSIAESFNTKVELTIDNLLHDGRRYGPPIINSFFLSLLNLEGYQYTYISQAILFSLFLPLIYIFFQILTGKSSVLGLLLSVVFVGFNANLLYILYHDFFGQVLFWGLEILLFIFLYDYFSSQELKSGLPNKYDFIIGILIAVLFFSYHEPAIFIFFPLLIFLLTKFIFRQNVIGYFKAFVKIGLISFTLGSTSVINALIFDFKQAFMSNPNQPIGWQLFRSKIPYANPFEAMGFWSIHNFEPMPTVIATVLSIMVVLIILIGIQKSRYKLLTSCYVITFSILYYWTAISQHNFFAYNRALTYTLPFMIVLFSIGLINLYEKNKFFLSIFLVILFLMELLSGIRLNKRFINEHLSVEKSYTTILDLKNKNLKEPIYFEGHIDDEMSLWKQIWIGHFLYSKKISLFPTLLNNDEFVNKIPDKSLLLISKSTPWLNAKKIIYRNIIWENNFYQLGHICNSGECLLNAGFILDNIQIGENGFEDSLLISGWSVNEGKTRWANEKESTLRLITKDTYPTTLTVEALSLKKPQEISVEIDGKLIGVISIGIDWQEYKLPIDNYLNEGVHKIKFIYSNGYRPMDVIPGNLDGRTLYVNFKKISLE